MKTILISNPEPAIQLTEMQAKEIGLNLNNEEQRGELKTFGVWNIPVSYKAICLCSTWDKDSLISKRIETKIFGLRTMTNVRQGGYELEGFVSVGGKKYSCFTSSQLFEVNGKLINAAIIHARI